MIKYDTGKIYDCPQVLEITKIDGGWQFVDNSRGIKGEVSSELYDIIYEGERMYQTDKEYAQSVGKYVKKEYDRGNYR